MAKRLGTINRKVDEYGFETLTIHTSEGGSKIIGYHGGIADIGSVSSTNPGGMGGSAYIRNAADVPRHMHSVLATVWLNQEEKGACIDFLNEIEQWANDFVEVRKRFDVKMSYQASEARTNTYTFTEKADQAATMHTKLTIVLEQPTGWAESDAWRALFAALKPTNKIMKKIYERKQG